MKMNEPKCVEMKRRGAEVVEKRLAGMSRSQELEYWRQVSKKMRESKDKALTNLSKGHS